MVHLSTVENDSEANAPPIKALEKVKLEEPDENELTETVYGSKYAAEGLPNTSMPEREMYVSRAPQPVGATTADICCVIRPKDIAYRLIKDHLSLDGNPVLNLAS